MQHRFGADVDLGVRRRRVVAARDGHDRPPGRRLELLAQPGDPGAQVGERRAPHTWHTAGRVVPQRAQRSVASSAGRPRRRRSRSAAAPDTADRRGCGPGRGCCARTRRALPGPQRGDEPRRHQRGLPRLLGAAVDHLDDRPPGAPPTTPGPRQRPADRVDAGHGRARRRHHHRDPGPPAPARRARRGRARWVPLLLQRLVVLVDHDRSGQPGARRPRRGTGADDHVDAGGGPRPLPWHHRHAWPRRASAAPIAAARSTDGITTSAGPSPHAATIASAATPPAAPPTTSPPSPDTRPARASATPPRRRPRAQASAARDVRRRAGGVQERAQSPSRPPLATPTPRDEQPASGPSDATAVTGCSRSGADLRRPGRGRSPSRRTRRP